MNGNEADLGADPAELADDTPVASTAKMRDVEVQRRRRLALLALLAVTAGALVVRGYPLWRVAIAIGCAYLILSIGFAVIGSFARPVPEPPPPGELRRVKLTYRCSSCGAELRMQRANDAVPDPPRHCADEMELITDLNDVY